MKINTPLSIAVFLGIAILSFATIIFYLAADWLNIFYGLGLFFLFVIVLIYYVVKKFFHEKMLPRLVTKLESRIWSLSGHS